MSDSSGMVKCAKCGKRYGALEGVMTRGQHRCWTCAKKWCLACDQRPRTMLRIPGSPHRIRHNRFCLTCLRLGSEEQRKEMVRKELGAGEETNE